MSTKKVTPKKTSVKKTEKSETPKVVNYIPTKEEIQNSVNELQHTGTLTEVMEIIAQKLGTKPNTLKRLQTELNITITKDEKTGVWTSPIKGEVLRLKPGTDLITEVEKIYAMIESGETFSSVGSKLKRHPGEVGRKYHLGKLIKKYPKVKTPIEKQIISSGLVFEIQRSTKDLLEQQNVIGMLVKNKSGNKVTREDYRSLTPVEDVVKAETIKRLKSIGHVK